MEIKSRQPLNTLQWLKDPIERLTSTVGRRTWVFVIFTIGAAMLAFYAGGKPYLRKPVVQFVNSVPINLSRVEKYVKGKLASPRKMQIDIKHTNYQKLRFKRDEAFRRGIIVADEDSFVPAQVTVDGHTYRVRMRLKGDYPDHLTGDKWSFRIIVTGENAIWGMKRFSIQDPMRSGWLKEWTMYQWFKYEDLFALRYDYIDVTINGRHLGIFAIEESFGKEFVENNLRTEGPILKFDESFWLDVDSVNRGDRASEDDVYQAADIISFSTSKTMNSEKLRNNFLAGRTLLNQLRARDKTLSEVMDVERAARTFAILDILGVYHGIRWKNSRFYFNPITARIEFIAYNMYAENEELNEVSSIAYQRWLNKSWGNADVTGWIDLFFSDEEFVVAYFDELNRMVSPGYLEKFFDSIDTDFAEKAHILYRNGSMDLVPIEDYLRNRDIVYELLHPKLSLKAYFKSQDTQTGKLALTVANTSFLPVRIEAVECESDGNFYNEIYPTQIGPKSSSVPLSFTDIEIRGVKPDDIACAADVARIGDSYVIKGLQVKYKIFGADEYRWTNVEAFPINIASTQLPPPSGIESLIASAPVGMVKVHEDGDQIGIQPGDWILTRDLVFPAGYRVVGSANTTIVLNEGAALISYSPVDFSGSAGSPIVVRSDDGTGQGLVVLRASEPSVLRHVLIMDNRSVERGSWTLTGTVTFYESEVSFANVYFENNKAEDMANLIRSNYEIRDSHFVGSAFDALDVDFGNGLIEGSKFVNCGNDCIDFSGSTSRIFAVEVNGAGDKGVSVGEQSRVDVINSSIANTNLGLASKDGSIAEVNGLKISHVVTALASYQKKPEYSGATLRATDVSLQDTESPYMLERGSMIMHDGKNIEVTHDVVVIP